MNGPTGQEVIGMMASEGNRSARAIEQQQYEARRIIEKWLPTIDDLSTIDQETMGWIITDLVAAVRVLSGLPAYETPADQWRREN